MKIGWGGGAPKGKGLLYDRVLSTLEDEEEVIVGEEAEEAEEEESPNLRGGFGFGLGVAAFLQAVIMEEMRLGNKEKAWSRSPDQIPSWHARRVRLEEEKKGSEMGFQWLVDSLMKR